MENNFLVWMEMGSRGDYHLHVAVVVDETKKMFRVATYPDIDPGFYGAQVHKEFSVWRKTDMETARALFKGYRELSSKYTADKIERSARYKMDIENLFYNKPKRGKRNVRKD